VDSSAWVGRIAVRLLGLVLLLMPLAALAAEPRNPLQPVDASSPQATMRSFFTLGGEVETAYFAFRDAPSFATQMATKAAVEKVLRLFDLSELPPSTRLRTGADVATYIMDVLNRIELPPFESIPDAKAYPDPDKPASWTIPGTDITIARNPASERKGAFVFNAETVSRAAEFHALVKDLPVRRTVRIQNWHAQQAQNHGWLVPAGLVAALPEALKHPILGNPAWKSLGTILVLLVAALIVRATHRLTRMQPGDRRPGAYLLRLLAPIVMALAVAGSLFLIAGQLIVTGFVSEIVFIAAAVLLYLSAGWALWLLIMLVVEWIIASPAIPDESLDANLLRLLGRLIGLLALAVIAAYAAQNAGLPVLGVVAGLGVGGLAVALAAQSSLENLIGGLNLYLDRPIRVGDYCRYGDIEGIVETIGLRSTRIRGLDRTITSVPNSEMAKVNITNYGARDQMLFRHSLSVADTPGAGQVRALTARIRDYLRAHPRVRTDLLVPRVHVTGFGSDTLTLDILAYLDTREIPQFLAVQEELILGIIERAQGEGAVAAA